MDNLTERQREVLRLCLSYSLANVDELAYTFDEDVSHNDVHSLFGPLGLADPYARKERSEK